MNLVHLRNILPTPANYGKRNRRTGLSGQPALVATDCSMGSENDPYFFRRSQLMVDGSVAHPRLDVDNEELIRDHVHAVWLAHTGVSQGCSIMEVLDIADEARNYPLKDDIALILQWYFNLTLPGAHWKFNELCHPWKISPVAISISYEKIPL